MVYGTQKVTVLLRMNLMFAASKTSSWRPSLTQTVPVWLNSSNTFKKSYVHAVYDFEVQNGVPPSVDSNGQGLDVGQGLVDARGVLAVGAILLSVHCV